MISLCKSPFKEKTSNNSGHHSSEQNLNLEVNARYAYNILKKLLENYDFLGEENDSLFKSNILQSFHALVSTDTKLIKEIVDFLHNKLKAFTIKDATFGVYFNLEKCLVDEKHLRISEPVDVLLNVAILCFTKGLETIRNHSLHEAFGSLVRLKALVKEIVKTYLNTEASSLVDAYNKQLSKLIKTQVNQASSIGVVQQVQFGVFDSIVEYLMLSESYG